MDSKNKNEIGFTENDIALKTATGDISGTLTIPDNAETSPIVLIIAGSGPTDRNCNAPLGVNTNAYKMIAEELAKNGISTLRFDKRGIAKSQAAQTSEKGLNFETYINDAVAWIKLLKSDKRFTQLYILGHSEGSLIGMRAAAQTNVSGFVSVAGVGRPADKILREQLKNKLPVNLNEESNKILDSLRDGKTVTNINPNLMMLYRPTLQPYMISWIKYNPAVEIAKLTMPVLIIQGNTDLQVSVEDAKMLSAAKPDAKMVIFENMNHILKESEADLQKNTATYANPNLPLKTGLMEVIINFINKK